MMLAITIFVVLTAFIMGIFIFFNTVSDDIVPAGICAIVISLIITMIFVKLKDEKVRTFFDKKEIISLSNDASYKGDFVLGIGSIKEKEYYIVMVKNQYGYIREKINVEDAYIFETNSESPGIKIEMVEIYNKLLKKYKTEINYDNKDLMFKQIIVVPVGTIKQKFKIED